MIAKIMFIQLTRDPTNIQMLENQGSEEILSSPGHANNYSVKLFYLLDTQETRSLVHHFKQDG